MNKKLKQYVPLGVGILLILLLILIIIVIAGSKSTKVTDNNNIVGEITSNDVKTLPSPPVPPSPPVSANAGVCGDGVLNSGEECDVTVPSSSSCIGMGYTGGKLTCLNDCKIDSTRCVNSVCVDSDEGMNYVVKGTVTVTTDGSTMTYTDYCRQRGGAFDDYVMEYYCDSNTIASDNHECVAGCGDGMCYD